jgi:putative oxidoreductase
LGQQKQINQKMKLTQNKLDLTLLTTRLIVAGVVFAHGVQKLFGWFGGFGFEGTMGFFTQVIGLPYIFALLIILGETVGMVALAAGLFSRSLSAAVIGIMLGAIATVHAPNGFFMNWGGTQQGEGFEFHIVVIALSFVTLVHGPGAFSLDKIFFREKKKTISAQPPALV